jgi:hypothetical protein
VAWGLQHVDSMSVKTLLPIVGVGSAFAIIGLATARRRSNERVARDGVREPRLASGVHPRVALDADVRDGDREGEGDAAFAGVPLTREFWDAAPDSYSLTEEPSRPAVPLEAYDTVDTEDLTAEWLTRATQAPGLRDTFDEADDPAEIPADSQSMISAASRHAATFEPDDVEPESDVDVPSR